MNKRASVCLTLSAALAIALPAISPEASAQASGRLRVISEQTVGGFAFPESVAYVPNAKVLYVSEFGSKLDPVLKDGMGRISKVALNGKILEQKFLPAAGGEALNKPKGIWVKGPADFCLVPQAGGLTVVVPDLVQSQLRFVQLQK